MKPAQKVRLLLPHILPPPPVPHRKPIPIRPPLLHNVICPRQQRNLFPQLPLQGLPRRLPMIPATLGKLPAVRKIIPLTDQQPPLVVHQQTGNAGTEALPGGIRSLLRHQSSILNCGIPSTLICIPTHPDNHFHSPERPSHLRKFPVTDRPPEGS